MNEKKKPILGQEAVTDARTLGTPRMKYGDDYYKYLEDAVKDADKICNYVIEKGEVYQNKSLNKQLQKECQTPSKEHKEKESERDL